MKVSKSLLQAIAVAVVVGTTAHSCTKEKPVTPEKPKSEAFNCAACGMG